MALSNSLLKALAVQVEAIVAGSSNTPAALRAAAATATNVAAMLEASARDLDADADRDPDRERGAAVARVETGEAARPSLLRELGPDYPLPLTSQPNPTHLTHPPTPQRPHRPPRSASPRRRSDK